MRNWYWNSSLERWQREPYMVKDYSILHGDYRATVVVVPTEITNKKGETELIFTTTGVRVEHLPTRTVREQNCDLWHLSGRTWFITFPENPRYKDKPGRKPKVQKVSGRGACRFQLNRGGRADTIGQYPIVLKSFHVEKGVPLVQHPQAVLMLELFVLADEAYQTWKMEQMAAARAA